jgi:hypothetical protein
VPGTDLAAGLAEDQIITGTTVLTAIERRAALRTSATAFAAVESRIRAPHSRILSARARQSRTYHTAA